MLEIIVRTAIPVLAAMGLIANSAAASGSEVTGLWLSEDQSLKVKIESCAASLCANIVWSAPGEDGQELRDVHNPDESKRKRSLVGIELFDGFKRVESGQWNGRAYNFDDGEFYEVALATGADGKLLLQGCRLGGLFCASEIWTRTPE
jgi:uncharacterized protein (DUF2147 family)